MNLSMEHELKLKKNFGHRMSDLESALQAELANHSKSASTQESETQTNYGGCHSAFYNKY